MLGLGKPKVNVKPTPPPRTPHWASSSSGYSQGPPRSGLNPNAAEFHPMWETDRYEIPQPAQPQEAEAFPEMTNLLGVNLLDEICGGAAVPRIEDDDEAA
ncbi:unnamed protein product [Durusdinium trenchii]|uniref:Uncharacterized protein n=1 Tax=Durusdinium trenchii TaxID=1381693 RepID=A0ABP0LBC9_9DINO